MQKERALIINKSQTIREIAFIVCTALNNSKEIAVLTGGAAAHVHAPNSVTSDDLNFVLSIWSQDELARQSLVAIGFYREGRYLKHPETPFWIEFPNGPLSIGDDTQISYMTIEENGQLLHVLNPTDSVRDRLIAYYAWNDLSSLQSAIAVALNNEIDLELIRTWSQKENSLEKFEVFLRRLERA